MAIFTIITIIIIVIIIIITYAVAASDESGLKTFLYRISDAGMQQQTAVIVTPGVQQPPATVLRPFQDKQAVGVGVLLIIVGCLGILFNVVDLAVGTGLSAYSTWQHGSSSYLHGTLSHISLGVVGHGIWCGVLVSVRVTLV